MSGEVSEAACQCLEFSSNNDDIQCTFFSFFARLDYSRDVSEAGREAQREVFVNMITLAVQCQK